MAYVGCIAGAIPIEDYRRGLIEAGFAHVEVIDSGSDLNAYAQVENQAVCCPPPSSRLHDRPRRDGVLLADHGPCEPAHRRGAVLHASRRVARSVRPARGRAARPRLRRHPGLAVVDAGCCSVGPAAVVDEALHARLADLLRRYDVNDYAASVKVFAVKPR